MKTWTPKEQPRPDWRALDLRRRAAIDRRERERQTGRELRLAGQAEAPAISHRAMRTVVRAAALAFGVKPHWITDGRQSRLHSRARQAAIYLIFERRESLRVTVTQTTVGNLLHRDHTTVLYHLRVAEMLALTDQDFADRLDMARAIANRLDARNRQPPTTASSSSPSPESNDAPSPTGSPLPHDSQGGTGG